MFMNVLLINWIIFGKSDPKDGWQCSWGWNKKELQNFPRARRETCQTIGWQIYFTSETETGRRGGCRIWENSKSPALVDNDGQWQLCWWLPLGRSLIFHRKQLKAEIISKTIRTRDCGQMVVTVKQTDREFEIRCQTNLPLLLKFWKLENKYVTWNGKIALEDIWSDLPTYLSPFENALKERDLLPFRHLFIVMRRQDPTAKNVMTMTAAKAILETCDIWDTDYDSDN